MPLRPYQTNMVERIMNEFREKKSVMCQMPTGTGKTEVFCEIIQRFLYENKNKRILVLVHRVELLRQIKSRLRTNFKIIAGTIDSNGLTNYQNNVIIGMVASVVNKNLDFSNWLLVIDEAHHSNANSYVNIIEKVLNGDKSKLLGVTATPARLDGKKLSDIYESLLVTPSLRKFIENDYLSKIRYYGIRHLDISQIDISRLTGDYDLNSASKLMCSDRILAETLSSYLSFAEGKKTLIFCVDIAHANEVKRKFNENNIHCDIINSKTEEYDRNKIVDHFKNSRNGVLINVLIFTEGFDCPDIDVVMLARPTQSITLYLQMVGRATRKSEGKEFGIILDNAANYMIHGLPTSNFDWKSMFSNTNGSTNQDFSKQNRNSCKIKAKSPPIESNNLEMYELIDEDCFSCYNSESDFGNYIDIPASHQIPITNDSKYLPNNIEAYYFKNDKCPKCGKPVHRFKNSNNITSIFDSTIPNFKLHSCGRKEELVIMNEKCFQAFPVEITLNPRKSIYEYTISKLNHTTISFRQMIYEEINENALNGLNPIIARRINDTEFCLSIFDIEKRIIQNIEIYVEKKTLDAFFQKEIHNTENDFLDHDEDFFNNESLYGQITTSDDELIENFQYNGVILEGGQLIQIGEQIWMTNNLNLDKFNNGDPIYEAKTNEEWIEAGRSKTPAWCYFNNDDQLGEKYGKLYNWYAVNDERNLAPHGWKIPAIKDWEDLITMLGGEDFANERLKLFDAWTSSEKKNHLISFYTGFSALPAGYRLKDGKFLQLGVLGNWWSTSDLVYDKQLAKFQSVFSEMSVNFKNKIQQGFKGNGYSVRCFRYI